MQINRDAHSKEGTSTIDRANVDLVVLHDAIKGVLIFR